MRFLPAAAACLLAAPFAAMAGDLKVSLSPGYTSGDYGSNVPTETFEAPLKIRYKEGPFRISVRIPYLAVSGPRTAVPDLGVVGAPSNGRRRGGSVDTSGRGRGADDTATAATTGGTGAGGTSMTSGLGDIGISGGVRVLGGGASDWFTLELGGGTKLPTGDKSRGLGVGQAGLSAQMTATIDFSKSLSLEVTAGRFFRTRRDNDLQLRDYMFGNASLTYDISPKLSVGANIDVQERAVTGQTAVVEAGLFVEYEIAPNWKVGANIFKGFTRDSAAWGMGLLVSRRFSI